jgi:hypothetical protein
VANCPFAAGKYLVHVRTIANGEEADRPHGAVASLNVENGNFYNSGAPFHGGIGPVLLSGDWSIQERASAPVAVEGFTILRWKVKQ